MGNITVEQIVAGIALITALCGGCYKLWQGFKTTVSKAVAEQFKAVTDQLASMSKTVEEISTQLSRVDIEGCKNFLVRCLADIERGEGMSETEMERFYEQYEHYINSGGNTYIKNKVDKLKAAGKL